MRMSALLLTMLPAALSANLPVAPPCPVTMARPATGWDSPAEVARRVRYLLGADWKTVVRRMSYEQRGRELPGPVATVDEAIRTYAGETPTITVTRLGIGYRNSRTGVLVYVSPVEGTYLITGVSGGRPHPFRGTVVGLTDRFVTNLELARAVAREFVAVGNRGRRGSYLAAMIPERTRLYGATWQKGKLLDAIARFGGERPHVYTDGYKVRIANRETGVEILDDPEGQYYRIVRPNGLGDLFLDVEGRLVVRQDAEGLAKTHFSYADSESVAERPTLERAMKYLRGELPDTSTTYRTPAAPPAPTLTAAPTSEPDLEKALGDPDSKVRCDEIAKIDWKRLDAEHRRQLLERAFGLDNSWEIGAYIALAARSGDRAWIDVLEGWVTAYRDETRGWKTYKREEARSAIRALRY